MFALFCKPVVIPTPNVNPALRSNNCRKSISKPSQTKKVKLTLETLQEPQYTTGSEEEDPKVYLQLPPHPMQKERLSH